MTDIGGPVLHYTIEQPLGAGGMGVVYRAVDTRLDRPVALKFLPESMAVNDGAKDRLLLEARAAAKLDHPNIGVVHDIEESDGRIFIVMALYEGESLKERLEQGPLDVNEALDIALQAASGLAVAHEKGMVHRDIKPANLFLTRGGLVKILDFGLVKVDESAGLTVAGTIVGTPEYMAPEQIRGQRLDGRTDLWSLGVVLYEMLTGQSPFRANGELPAIILQVMSGRPPSVSELRPDVPPGVAAVIERTLARSPDERYGGADELVEELDALLEEGRSASGVVTTGPVVAWSAADDAPPESDTVADLSLQRAGSSEINILLEHVPRVQRFIGREATLGELRKGLERERVVAVRGIAGTGKTALGAQLARDVVPESDIFWFTFDTVEKNGIDPLFWSLAAFLRSHGETLLWRYLQGEIEAHKPLDLTVRTNLLLSSLSSGQYVFCLDDLHLVAANSEVTELLKILRRQISQDGLDLHARFILMGRELPAGIGFRADSLAGFDPEEAAALLEVRDVQGLAPELTRRLCDRTAGNPTILDLCAASLARLVDDPGAQAEFIESMSGRGDIRDYVMEHIYADLPETEKEVLGALSIFAGPVELDAAEETLVAGGLQGVVPCVDSLVQKAIVQETSNGQVYCHELVREYCYRSLERPARRALHEHAASYYEGRKNYLRASHHLIELGEQERALGLLVDNLKSIIDGGGAASLVDGLGRFDLETLSDEQQLALFRARGEANFVRGEFREAVRLYGEALDEAFDEADEAELLCRIASALDMQGEQEQALDYARRSLAAFESLGDDSGTAQVRRVMGWALYRLGRLEEAESEFLAGSQLAESIGDRHLLAQFQQGLGVIDGRNGRLEEARSRLESCRRSFRELRDRIGEAEAAGNLAWVHGRLGNTERELSLDRKVLEILERIGDVGNLLIAHNNLGDLYCRNGSHEEAIEQYRKLATLAGRIEHAGWQIAAEVGLAENLLALGRTDEAHDHAHEAHRRGQAAPDPTGVAVEMAMSCRILGEVHLELGRSEEARDWFEESIPTLEEANEEEELSKARCGLQAALAHLEGREPAPSREGEYEQA